MQFNHTWELVLSGAKTQTRRLIKPHERQRRDVAEDGTRFIEHVVRGDGSGWVDTKDRIIYYIGQTLAVQPGRGQKAVGRIEITAIRREDVRNISHEDAVAEGFKSPEEFIGLWIALHDPMLKARTGWFSGSWAGLADNRPAEYYQAWVLEFRLVEGGS